jgi:ribosomal protein S3
MTAGEDGLNVKIAGRLPGRAVAVKEVRGLR